MSQVSYNPAIKKVIDGMLLEIPGVAPGKMFGYPAYYANGKMFACVYEDGVGVKVPGEMAARLIGQEGILPFVPLGRRQMKEWIFINRENPGKYINDIELFQLSYNYVASLWLQSGVKK